ncbi:MAG: ribonuclease T2, partial [Hyphomonadaceae bacterium]|nr:ribonuclease T2 [Hyphomonadaceae bacterium]
MKRAVLAGGLLLLAAGVAGLLLPGAGQTGPTGAAPRKNVPVPDRPPFDFYVLALSWSPTWCADAERPDPQQCNGPRPFGFVVHGLWPQFERGYPRSCTPSARPPDRDTLEAAQALYPSPRLARMQWERHGTCSGLDGADYFTVTRLAAAAVQIPAPLSSPRDWTSMRVSDIEQAFMAANPGLAADGIAVEARGNRLREVRVCLDLDL